MAKGKKKPTDPVDSCAQLIPRLEKLEKIISQHFGVGIEELAESEEDNPVVDEKRYDRGVLKIHKSGAIEHLRICPHCQAEVQDLPSHLSKCPKRPIY